MGLENLSAHHRSRGNEGVELPTSAATSHDTRGRVLPGIFRVHQIEKTVNISMFVVVCGILSILVLRHTIGIGSLEISEPDIVNHNVIVEGNQIAPQVISNNTKPDEPRYSQANQISPQIRSDNAKPNEPVKLKINPIVPMNISDNSKLQELVQPKIHQIIPQIRSNSTKPDKGVEPKAGDIVPNIISNSTKSDGLTKPKTNQIVPQTRLNSTKPDQPTEPETNPSVTYTLGPKITNWDQKRKTWLSQNPGFPNYVNGKARILLVTGSPPKPCEDPIGDHYLLKAVKNKIDYCRIHGIEIVYNMAFLDEELAGYWAKLPLIRRLMLSHPEVEWIWWMDSDALFTDMVFEIPIQKYENYNLVVHGYPDLMFDEKNWIALNTGSFFLRNCQWSLDLLDAWAPMGPKGKIRDEAGKILTAYLKGRPAFEADDQSALIYLLLSQKEKWLSKFFLENSYYLHGYWVGLVDKYEEMMEKYHPGFGDERWPFVTHFVGCKPCGKYGDYPVEKCFSSMERAFNFADNQVLKMYGFRHRGLLCPKIKRIRNETVNPLVIVDQFDIRRHPVQEIYEMKYNLSA